MLNNGGQKIFISSEFLTTVICNMRRGERLTLAERGRNGHLQKMMTMIILYFHQMNDKYSCMK